MVHPGADRSKNALYKVRLPDYHGVMEPIIAPSLLSADFSDFTSASAEISASGAEWLHFDIMDGGFVPNLTYGPKLVADLRPKSKLIFDTHLMVREPERLVPAFLAAGADAITFHVEAEVHILRLLALIRNSGRKAGISMIPSSPTAAVEALLPFVDIVLVMTVCPGFGGQRLIPECLEKMRALARLRQEEGLSFLIAADGGINEKTAGGVREAGADVLITGSAFFGAPDKPALIRRLKGFSN